MITHSLQDKDLKSKLIDVLESITFASRVKLHFSFDHFGDAFRRSVIGSGSEELWLTNLFNEKPRWEGVESRGQSLEAPIASIAGAPSLNTKKTSTPTRIDQIMSNILSEAPRGLREPKSQGPGNGDEFGWVLVQ